MSRTTNASVTDDGGIRVAGPSPGARAKLVSQSASITAPLAALILCLALWRSDRNLAAEVADRSDRARPLAADAGAIILLRERPTVATDRDIQTASLLDQVAQAMRDAKLPAEALVSTLPPATPPSPWLRSPGGHPPSGLRERRTGAAAALPAYAARPASAARRDRRAAARGRGARGLEL